MYPVAPVRKIRIGGVYHSSVVARETLIDFFHDFSRARGEFLVYDDGFRSRSYSYEETSRRATQFAVRLHDFGLRQGDAVVFAVNYRPVKGARGFYRTVLRPGVSRIRSGRRHTVGIIFHDAK